MARRKIDRPLFDRCQAQRGYLMEPDRLFDARPDDPGPEDDLTAEDDEDAGIARFKRIHAKIRQEESDE